MTYLTVPISASDLSEAVLQVKAAQAKGAEAVELRTDYLKNLSVDAVKELVRKSRESYTLALIVTCRDKTEGGCLEYPDNLRVDVLAAAIEAGADFIDFEYENYQAEEKRGRIKSALSQNTKAKLILSSHNFKGKFADIHKLYGDILTLEPDAIPKLVYTANHINDCFESFDLLHQAERDSIVFCMGEAGKVSRIVAKKLGSFVSFASLDEESSTAPGQITIEQLKGLYRYDSINEKTELYGIVGSPAAHSLSPLLHNGCFDQINVNKLYLPLLVDGDKNEFDEFMENVLSRDWLDFRGFSVTIPHKQNAINFVKEKKGFIEPLAEKIGAANTIIKSQDTSHKSRAAEGKNLAAYNTDYAGALDAITSGMNFSRADLKDIPTAVIGAGGAARAIVAGLRDAGAKVKIYNRTIEKAEKLATEFGCEYAGLDELPNLRAKLVINCTSIGMYPNVKETPLSKELIKKDMTVFDTVYNPRQSRLLKEAKETGAKTIDGLSMFINQAATQFELFTGKFVESSIIKSKINNINYWNTTVCKDIL